MKTTTHSQTLLSSSSKKAYKKPVVKLIGSVGTLTKSNKGSIDDDGGGTLKP